MTAWCRDFYKCPKSPRVPKYRVLKVSVLGAVIMVLERYLIVGSWIFRDQDAKCSGTRKGHLEGRDVELLGPGNFSAPSVEICKVLLLSLVSVCLKPPRDNKC